MIALRPLAAADLAPVCRWFDDAAAVVSWAGTGLGWPLVPAMLAAGLDDPDQQAIAGEMDGTLAAHALLRWDRRNDVALLTRVAIAPARRAQGLALPFVRAVVARAFAAGAARVELNVYAQNTQAIGVYRRAGFAAEGVRRSCARVDGARWDCVAMGMLAGELVG